MFKGSNLKEIIEEMFAHMQTQVENRELANSRICVWSSLVSRCQFS